MRKDDPRPNTNLKRYMPKTKADLRRASAIQRNTLTYDEVRLRSQQIIEGLVRLPEWQSAKRVCAYISFGKEVSTHQLIRSTLEKKMILAPRIDGLDLAWYRIENWDKLQAGQLGILEPAPDPETHVSPPAPDLVLVPGLRFDRHGYRIGYGGGYYDRFLSRTAVYKLGLAYDWQISDTLPSEAHDIALDAIMTENGLIKCGSDQ